MRGERAALFWRESLRIGVYFLICEPVSHRSGMEGLWAPSLLLCPVPWASWHPRSCQVLGLLAGYSLGEGQLAQLHEAPNWGIWPVSSSCPRGVDPDLLFPAIHQQLRWFTFRLVLGAS